MDRYICANHRDAHASRAKVLVIVDAATIREVLRSKMPYMKRLRAHRRAARRRGTRHILLVLLSSDPDAEVQGRELGVAALLQKPVSAERLVRSVERLVALAA